MVGLDQLRAWVPRVLAPLAFFVAATVLILLVQNALSSTETPASPATNQTGTAPQAGQTGTGAATTEERPRRRFYRVREGDLLDTIAAEFNTSTARLLELNPGIDPQALTVGQRIRVR